MKLIGKLRRRNRVGREQHASAHREQPSWLEKNLHHLQVALAVASLVGLLHTYGHLGWLDAVMLRMVGAESSAAKDSAATPVLADMPEVLLIDEGLYDREFQQRSPLDRGKLAELMQAAFSAPQTRPKTLVIDLDLSDTGHDPGQEKLHLVLWQFIQSGMNVVLPMPVGVNSPEGVARKLKWITETVCGWDSTKKPEAKGRAILASPLLQTHAGLVLQYAPRELSLGVAARLPEGAENVCGQSSQQILPRLSQPQAAETAELRVDGTDEPERRPYNANFFSALNQHVRVLKSAQAPWGDNAQPNAPALAGKVVFLGGTYDMRDSFSTPLARDGKPVEGVTMHAATYYSAAHPVANDLHYRAWFIDVVVGFVMGWAFAWLWGWYARAGRRPGWGGYWWPKLLLVVNLAAAAALSWAAVLSAAHWAYPNNLWISPGPVVLGVFVKLLLTRLHGADSHAHSQSHRTGHVLDWLVVLGLVVACLVAIHNHH